jgi:aminoglycoside phosphotransferase (APT) family kinase protein
VLVVNSAVQGGPEAAGAVAVLEEANTALDGTYTLARPLPGGFQSGAWLIEDDTGRQAVLKWTPNRLWAEQIQRASRAVAVVRRCSYPTPAWLAVGTTGSGSGYQVQEYAPGRPREYLTEATACRAVDVLELQKDLDPDPERSWSEYVTNKFSDEWASTIAGVSATGSAGAELVGHASRLLSRYELPVFARADLVHGDFRLGNILFDEDIVSGVIDIEALGSGTRVFDYATLLDDDRADDSAVELLVDAGSDVAGPAVLAYCLVHVFLDLARFMHRSQLPAVIHQADRRISSLRTRLRLVSRLLT